MSKQRPVYFDQVKGSYIPEPTEINFYQSSSNPGGDDTLWQRDDGVMYRGSVNLESGGGGGSGDVVGPASSTDNALALFDGVTGKLLKNGVIVENNGVLENVEGMTFTPVVINPGGLNTLWVENGTDDLVIGSTNMTQLIDDYETRIAALEDLIRRGSPGEVEMNGALTIINF